MIGNISAVPTPVNLGIIILRELRVLGSSSATETDLKEVLQMVAEGSIKPMIDRILPLKDVEIAHRLLMEKGVVGRIVLNCMDPIDSVERRSTAINENEKRAAL